jgi:hypothetical protein
MIRPGCSVGRWLIYVADRITTFQLIRRGTEMGSPLNPILDVLR